MAQSLSASGNIMAIAGNSALAFLNSTYTLSGIKIENLKDAAALLDWLKDTALLSARDCSTLRTKFNEQEFEELLAKTLELRDRLRVVISTFKESGFAGIPIAEFAYLNGILAFGKHHYYFDVNSNNKLEIAQKNEWNSIHEALAVIAESMLELLSTEDPSNIKLCADNTCGLWFIDRTKAHRRQWCTQSGCGNRAKVAAFRARQTSKK